MHQCPNPSNHLVMIVRSSIIIIQYQYLYCKEWFSSTEATYNPWQVTSRQVLIQWQWYDYYWLSSIDLRYECCSYRLPSNERACTCNHITTLVGSCDSLLGQLDKYPSNSNNLSTAGKIRVSPIDLAAPPYPNLINLIFMECTVHRKQVDWHLNHNAAST